MDEKISKELDEIMKDPLFECEKICSFKKDKSNVLLIHWMYEDIYKISEVNDDFDVSVLFTSKDKVEAINKFNELKNL